MNGDRSAPVFRLAGRVQSMRVAAALPVLRSTRLHRTVVALLAILLAESYLQSVLSSGSSGMELRRQLAPGLYVIPLIVVAACASAHALSAGARRGSTVHGPA